MKHIKDSLNSVGWFIPPYVTMGFINNLASEIKKFPENFSQESLEKQLGLIYSADHLSAMVMHRYSETNIIKDYSEIIAECIVAHFSCLDHLAVAGLLTVIEGAGKRICNSRGIELIYKGKTKSTKQLFEELAESCKTQTREKKMGMVEEVITMLDSFKYFVNEHLFTPSHSYSLSDKTNRHGILHGLYSDNDYGTPLNFYKSIAAVNFLCFISSFKGGGSWFAPDTTPESVALSKFYIQQSILSSTNPKPGKRLGYNITEIIKSLNMLSAK